MAIHVYTAENSTVVHCDKCGAAEATNMGNGLAPLDWVTGQLWIDVSIQQQKQTPICFCPTCGPLIISADKLQILNVWVASDVKTDPETNPVISE